MDKSESVQKNKTNKIFWDFEIQNYTAISIQKTRTSVNKKKELAIL